MVKINFGIIELEIHKKTDQKRLKNVLKKYEKEIGKVAYTDFEKMKIANKVLDEEGLFIHPDVGFAEYATAPMIGLVRRKHPPAYEEVLTRKLVDGKLTLDDLSKNIINASNYTEKCPLSR